MHCIYTKVCQNYFPFEQLSALVYTPRWVEEGMDLWNKALKNQKDQNTKKRQAVYNYTSHANKKVFHHLCYQRAHLKDETNESAKFNEYSFA